MTDKHHLDTETKLYDTKISLGTKDKGFTKTGGLDTGVRSGSKTRI